MLQQVKTEPEEYATDIAKIQEIRWKGSGVRDKDKCTLVWSGSESNAVGVVVRVMLLEW
jgi:hypothetical protein